MADEECYLCHKITEYPSYCCIESCNRIICTRCFYYNDQNPYLVDGPLSKVYYCEDHKKQCILCGKNEKILKYKCGECEDILDNYCLKCVYTKGWKMYEACDRKARKNKSGVCAYGISIDALGMLCSKCKKTRYKCSDCSNRTCKGCRAACDVCEKEICDSYNCHDNCSDCDCYLCDDCKLEDSDLRPWCFEHYPIPTYWYKCSHSKFAIQYREQYKKLEDRYYDMIKKYDNMVLENDGLRLEIKYQPGGEGYQEAKEEFESHMGDNT